MNRSSRITRGPLRYPRTSGEAFKGMDYASAIERPYPSFWRRFIQHVLEVLS